jgi:hypothetical protein
VHRVKFFCPIGKRRSDKRVQCGGDHRLRPQARRAGLPARENIIPSVSSVSPWFTPSCSMVSCIDILTERASDI